MARNTQPKSSDSLKRKHNSPPPQVPVVPDTGRKAPTKKTKPNEDSQQSKKSKDKDDLEKGQITLSQTVRRRSERLSAPDQAVSTAAQVKAEPFSAVPASSNLLNRSFDTNLSEDVDPVFSDPEIDPTSSNDTSLADWDNTTDNPSTRFSGGTQLDHEFQSDVNLNRSFRTLDTISQPLVKLLDDVATSGPFKAVRRQLSEHLNFWYTFELYRLSLHLGCDVGSLFHKIKTVCGTDDPGFSRFWAEVVTICRDAGKPVPQKSDLKSWTYEDNLYIDKSKSKSVSFSARLDFGANPDKELFNLKLHPPSTDRSCRFHRKFGADRFLILDIPCFAPEWPMQIPEKLRTNMKPEDLHNKIWDWLGQEDLYIAGRMWRAFYVEGKDNKKKRKEEGNRLKVCLFAVHGFDFATHKSPASDPRHRAVSLLELVQWHIPLDPNSQSTDLKLFARIHLGLSRTTPTVVLEPSEFIYVPDKKPQGDDGKELDNGLIMTDGCSRISYNLATAIWKEIGKDSESMPSAFQARIGGSKGLWIVDYHDSHQGASSRGFWIEVSDSQLKIQPHPKDRLDADEHQRTFEVVKMSHPCTSANLNIQLISILENRNVPRLVLAELLLAELRDYYDSLSVAMKDPAELRRWRQLWHPTRSSHVEISWCGDLPDEKADEADMLLEAGFHPEYCRHLTKQCIWRIVSQGLADKQEKLWIKVPFSTNLFCVPDPIGVLKEGEIQVNFSQPVSEFPEWKFENRKVLVARNPAHLPSDIQAVMSVYKPELRHLKDVIIFPVKGSVPLADLLSGGDYDGDTITLIWDDRLTKHFTNAAKPVLPTKKECGIVSENAYVRDTFSPQKPSSIECTAFIRKCLAFNGISSRLGQVTKLAEKMCYARPQHMEEPAYLILGALCGYLVDSAKGGDSFSPQAWKDLNNRIMLRYIRKFKLPDTPAYDDNSVADTKHRWAFDQACISVLDFLKFDVAMKQSNRILTNFDKDFDPANTRDNELKAPIDQAWKLATKAKAAGDPALSDLLKALKEDTEIVHQKWIKQLGATDSFKDRHDVLKIKVDNPVDYAEVLNELMIEVNSIEPRPCDCYVYKDFRRNGGGKGTAWSILRASSIYSTYYMGKMPWKLVGDELCWIKSTALRRHGTRVRTVVQPIRDLMKMDLKKQRRLVAADEENDENDDMMTVAGSEAV